MKSLTGAKKTQSITAEKSNQQATQNQSKIKIVEKAISVQVQQVSDKKPTVIKGIAANKTNKVEEEKKLDRTPPQNKQNKIEEKKYDVASKTQNKPKSNASDSSAITFGVPTSEEKELINIINQYRREKGLKAIPLSVSLTKVAQIHARDIVENSPDVDGGNMHSWSDKGSWKPCKYTSDHKQAALMWSKPSELTSYKGHGFEIAHGYSGEARKTYQTTAKSALDGWKKSPGHNAVIIEDGIWKGKNFQALGVGIYKGFACAWFGLEPDKTS